jgi:hypothetical protein
MRLVLVSAALVVLAACTSSSGGSSSSGSSSGATTCPDDLPAACPTNAPTYTTDIAPIVQASCTPCHAPGGTESGRLLTTYAGISAQSGSALNQVYACRMPPLGSPRLSAADRTALMAWLVCGAPND